MNKYQEKHKDDPEYKAKNAARARAWYLANQERVAGYRKVNRERILKYNAGYHQATREARLAKKREYAEANRELLRAKAREYYWADPAKARARTMAWDKANPEAVLLKNRAREARVKGGHIVKEDIHNWHTRICGICTLPIQGKFHFDHIIPLSRGGEHKTENLQLAHPRCNNVKHNKLQGEIPPNVLMLS